MPLRLVTLTGADDGTSLEDLFSVGREHPQAVEWGILLSYTRAGEVRYPSLDWIDRLAGRLLSYNALGTPRPRFSLHICGTPALDGFLSFKNPATLYARAFDRVQLNLRWNPKRLDQIRAVMAAEPARTIITQHNEMNAPLSAHLAGVYGNHAVLFDGSGGRGKMPESWPQPLTETGAYGYAGGLGPDNLADALPAIAAVCPGRAFWVDMESSLRSRADRFDLDAARRCLDIAWRAYQVDATDK